MGRGRSAADTRSFASACWRRCLPPPHPDATLGIFASLGIRYIPACAKDENCAQYLLCQVRARIRSFVSSKIGSFLRSGGRSRNACPFPCEPSGPPGVWLGETSGDFGIGARSASRVWPPSRGPPAPGLGDAGRIEESFWRGQSTSPGRNKTWRSPTSRSFPPFACVCPPLLPRIARHRPPTGSFKRKRRTHTCFRHGVGHPHVGVGEPWVGVAWRNTLSLRHSGLIPGRVGARVMGPCLSLVCIYVALGCPSLRRERRSTSPSVGSTLTPYV